MFLADKTAAALKTYNTATKKQVQNFGLSQSFAPALFSSYYILYICFLLLKVLHDLTQSWLVFS